MFCLNTPTSLTLTSARWSSFSTNTHLWTFCLCTGASGCGLRSIRQYQDKDLEWPDHRSWSIAAAPRVLRRCNCTFTYSRSGSTQKYSALSSMDGSIAYWSGLVAKQETAQRCCLTNIHQEQEGGKKKKNERWEHESKRKRQWRRSGPEPEQS